MNQVKTKKFGLRYFCRFVACGLTLRPENTCIYVFQAFFKFCNFEVTCCSFWKLEVSSLNFKLNFE